VGDQAAAAGDVSNRLDPESAALYAIVAICFTLVGALLTPGTVGVEERGAVLVAIGTVLFAVAWRGRRRGD
jgi:hypothetical protein